MYHALIRTHHITSRKKVATLKAAAKKHCCSALLRSGGTPGIMYVRGDEGSVKAWVGIVRDLRYKDYHLVAAPAPIENNPSSFSSHILSSSNNHSDWSFEEFSTVKDFGKQMEDRCLLDWWRKAMDFTS